MKNFTFLLYLILCQRFYIAPGNAPFALYCTKSHSTYIYSHLIFKWLKYPYFSFIPLRFSVKASSASWGRRLLARATPLTQMATPYLSYADDTTDKVGGKGGQSPSLAIKKLPWLSCDLSQVHLHHLWWCVSGPTQKFLSGLCGGSFPLHPHGNLENQKAIFKVLYFFI